MATSHLDELLALRPVDTAPSQDIQTAIDAIRAKGHGYVARAAELRDQRQASILKMSGEQILALDREIGLMEIGGEQAAALVPALIEQRKLRGRSEWHEQLEGQHNALATRRQDLAERFHAFYAGAAGEFMAYMTEAAQMAVETRRFNAVLAKAEAESGFLHLYEMAELPISQVYRDRVCLPGAGIAEGEMADDFIHKGREVVIQNPNALSEAQVLAGQIATTLNERDQALAEVARLRGAPPVVRGAKPAPLRW